MPGSSFIMTWTTTECSTTSSATTRFGELLRCQRGYLIPNLPPGNYIVDVYEDSITTDGIRDTVPTTGENVVVGLVPGNMSVDTADFGYYVGARVEALVFWDENQNGVRDSGESRLSGITVTLTGTDNSGNPVPSPASPLVPATFRSSCPRATT